MAKGGRIILDKDGKLIAAHHLDPRIGGHKPDDVKAAHGYVVGANKDFVERSADENAALAKAAAGKEGK